MGNVCTHHVGRNNADFALPSSREARLRTAVNEARFAMCSRVVAELGEKQKTLEAQK